ncbi:MAG: hypothetical protein ACI9K2_006637 [Myxococcota bacterium]|jgi:hypothetical protein
MSDDTPAATAANLKAAETRAADAASALFGLLADASCPQDVRVEFALRIREALLYGLSEIERVWGAPVATPPTPTTNEERERMSDDSAALTRLLAEAEANARHRQQTYGEWVASMDANDDNGGG